MHRKLTGYHQDAETDWVAEFECGHRRHLRHDPPFQERAWVEDAAERAARIGMDFDCLLCERRELPPDYVETRRTPSFDAASIPAGLRRRHTTKAGVWAKICVVSGALTYQIEAPINESMTLGPGDVGIVMPGVEHSVTPRGAVEFYVAFFAPSDRTREAP